MKRTVRNVLVAAAAIASVAVGPVATATATPDGVVAVRQDENRGGDQDEDHGLWGLLGLVGLVGLLGLIRRGRAGDRLAGPADAPPATESEARFDRQARRQYAEPVQPPHDRGRRQP